MEDFEQETSEKDVEIDQTYEKVARKLEEKCTERNARLFYARLQKMPTLCQKLEQIATENIVKDLEFKKIDLSLGKMETMALDFFQTLDEELCENVWTVLEDTENTILFVKKPSEKSGKNVVGVVKKIGYKKRNPSKKLESKKIEISLMPRNDVWGYMTVAHELAHTMEERVQKRTSQKVAAICEIVPMFFERLYADYLLKKGAIDQKDRDDIFTELNNDYIKNARAILEEKEILGQLHSPITAVDLKTLDEKYKGSPKRMKLLRRIKTMIDENQKDQFGEMLFRYIVGEIVSKELYKDFQKDPEKTMKKVKNFAQNNAHVTAQEGFQMLLGENFEERLGFEIGHSKNRKGEGK